LTKELEIAAAAAVGGLAAPAASSTPTEGRCRNCDAPLHGRYCHACGQGADDHHRSIVRLAWEAVEGLTHLDGRIAKTLPALLFRPGRLAADYTHGRLNRHIPPLRLFLISLLIFMLSLEVVVRQGVRTAVANTAMANSIASTSRALSVSVGAANVDTTSALGAAPSISVDVENGKPVAVRAATPAQAQAAAAAVAEARRAVAAARAMKARGGVSPSDASDAADTENSVSEAVAAARGDASPQAKWIREHLARALSNPQFYMTVVFEWAHRLAFLLLPILAAELTVLYFYRRRIFVYDHLMVALQYLSFCFLLWAAVWLAPIRFWGWIIAPALIWTPVNLFMTLRGAYGSSVIGAGIKALFLWISTLFAFGVLIVGLLALALGQV
jgi:Protein of unknown function (DUF3667)